MQFEEGRSTLHLSLNEGGWGHLEKGGGVSYIFCMCSTYTFTLVPALGGPRAGTRAIHIMYLYIATAEVVITETEERERQRERVGGGGRAMKQLVN